MAVVNGTVHSVHTIRADAVGKGVAALQLAEILFYITSGTYAQADNAQLQGLAALISASRRNGKTITLVDVAPSQAASKSSDGAMVGMKTVALAGADATFELTDSDWTTELGNGAVPAQHRPFGLLVAFTES